MTEPTASAAATSETAPVAGPEVPVEGSAAATSPAPTTPAAAAPPSDGKGAPGGKPFKSKFRPQGEKPRNKLQALPEFGESLKLSQLDKEIEAELAAAMGEFAEIQLQPTEAEKARNNGPRTAPPSRRKGRVMSVHGADVFIEFPNGRSQGVCQVLQFGAKAPAIGSEHDFDVTGYDSADGLIQCSLAGAAQIVDWSSVAVGTTVEARVTATNRGGLSVEVNGIRGFMPFREIDMYRIEQPEALINQKLICMVQEVNPTEKNLVVSRRAILEREREEKAQKFWEDVEQGDILKGVVRTVKDFGVFVDLGGVDGMIPAGELGWGRNLRPDAIVKVGQSVEVKVTRVDYGARKLSLSLKELMANPWDTFRDRYSEGTRIKGKVTRVMDFGAFVEIEEGIEGLIHISELGPGRVQRVRDVVTENKEVEAMITNIDLQERRVGLSIRAVHLAAVKAANAEAMKHVATEEDEEEETIEVKPRKLPYGLRGGR